MVQFISVVMPVEVLAYSAVTRRVLAEAGRLELGVMFSASQPGDFVLF